MQQEPGWAYPGRAAADVGVWPFWGMENGGNLNGLFFHVFLKRKTASSRFFFFLNKLF